MVADFRAVRGKHIAEVARITRQGDRWLVPSQSSSGHYAVKLGPDYPSCACPDYDHRGMKCKHIFAVEFSQKRQEHADGSITTTRTVTVVETVKKPTYKQDWPAYNAAQTNEKDKFQSLLSDLCRGIVDDTPKTEG